MSINRTRWLDKLRPAGASSGGWTEGPMAPVETTDAATVDQRCPFKHRTGWRHNHSNSNCVSPCAWVKLIFSVSRIVIFAQVPWSLRPTTRFTRVILVRMPMRMCLCRGAPATLVSKDFSKVKGSSGARFFVVLQCEEPQKTDHRKQTGISPEWADVSASGFPEVK